MSYWCDDRHLAESQRRHDADQSRAVERMERKYPAVILCTGGWFAVRQKGDIGSGPRRNREAAEFALKEDWAAANAANDRP